MKLNIVLSFLVTISLATDYSKHGDDWTGRDEVCKKGYRQSPLNIQENPNKTDSLAFKLVNYHEMRNATINVDQDGSRIIVIDPNMQHSYLTFKNVSSDIWRMFTLRGMQWKVPAEH
jgi:carbonic anhydrase